MHLTEVHPDGYGGYWGIESTERKSLLYDPEANIAMMHDPREREKIISSDVSHWWREQLKAWGVTAANKNERDRRNFREAIERLKKEGVWEMIVKRSTIEELEMVRRVLKASQEPIRIDESSDNLTIYPDEASWWKDIYGTVPKEVLIKELTG